MLLMFDALPSAKQNVIFIKLENLKTECRFKFEDIIIQWKKIINDKYP